MHRILVLEPILEPMLVAEPSREPTLDLEITQDYIMDQQIIQVIIPVHSRGILLERFLGQQYKQLKKQCHLLNCG